MKLSELKNGESGIVKSIGCEKPLKTRLNHLGLTEGVKIMLVKKAPLNDPVEIMVRGFYLAIRVKTAESIEIEKL